MSDKKSFIDTNIWLYAFILSDDNHKTEAAKQLIEGSTIAVSSQVINELCANLLKKTSMCEKDISNIIASFYHRYEVVQFSKNILLHASKLRQESKFSFWDSLIVASALNADAKFLYSEDMHDGLVVEKKLEIVNPFKESSY
jgi:predicted nucleic acid-binding protein